MVDFQYLWLFTKWYMTDQKNVTRRVTKLPSRRLQLAEWPDQRVPGNAWDNPRRWTWNHSSKISRNTKWFKHQADKHWNCSWLDIHSSMVSKAGWYLLHSRINDHSHEHSESGHFKPSGKSGHFRNGLQEKLVAKHEHIRALNRYLRYVRKPPGGVLKFLDSSSSKPARSTTHSVTVAGSSGSSLSAATPSLTS